MSKARRALLEQRWLRWLIILGLWTFLGVFDAVQSYGLVRLLDKPIIFEELLVLSLAEWYLWAALAPLVVMVGQTFLLDQARWRSRVALLLGASAFFAAVKVALDFPIEMALRLPYTPVVCSQTPAQFFQVLFMARYMPYLFICWAILVNVQALEFYRKYRRRESEASALEAELARTQLQVLKMQLHPHFLFNTLNAISALMHRDVEVADRMIARLGGLLRLTLENGGTQEVPLQQELDFVETYLEIEQARLGPRLEVRVAVEAGVRDALVPNLILQPLVENAVRHAIAPFSRAGRIEIAAWRVGGRLHLQVRDDGPGLAGAGEFKEGLGLSNTRARLAQLYGKGQHFEMADRPGRGLAVTLTLPFHDAGAEEASVPTEPADEDSSAYRR